jgi:hypothetical protein
MMPYSSEVQPTTVSAPSRPDAIADRAAERAQSVPSKLARRLKVWSRGSNLPTLAAGLLGAYALWKLVLPSPENRLPPSIND